MGRPKSKIKRKTLSTTIKVDLLEKVKKISENEGIPINKLLEISLEKYLENIKVNILNEGE